MLRITGGRWRGRRLETLAGDATRPSMDAHRLSLLNVIGQDLTGERVLDLFAGSGAFAFECLSRGAARAVLVEQSRPALEVIRANLATLAPARGTAELVTGDCYALPGHPALAGEFDLVFVAPPYPHFRERAADLDALLAKLAAGAGPGVAPGGVVIVQSDAADFTVPDVAGLRAATRKVWGRTAFTLLEPGAPPAPKHAAR